MEDTDGDGSSLAFNLRFPGQWYDSITQLNYNYFRDYDATVGRYVESDPLGLDAGVATYTYVIANPLGHRDPLGLFGDTPGEYCDPMRGIPCGSKPRNWCGPLCTSKCDEQLRKDLNMALEHYLETECDPDDGFGRCEVSAAGQHYTLQLLARRRWRECRSNCKQCPSCPTN